MAPHRLRVLVETYGRVVSKTEAEKKDFLTGGKMKSVYF